MGSESGWPTGPGGLPGTRNAYADRGRCSGVSECCEGTARHFNYILKLPADCRRHMRSILAQKMSHVHVLALFVYMGRASGKALQMRFSPATQNDGLDAIRSGY